MKVGHAADLHFGMAAHGRPGPGGVSSRILDIERTWSAAVDIFVDQQVDLVIVAGDVFHTPHPDAESLARFAKHLRRLTCPTLLITGNHERAAHPGRSCVLEAFADHLGDDVVVSTSPQVIYIADLTVATLPSVSRHRLASLMGTPRADVDTALMDNLVTILGTAVIDAPDILTLHWPIQGSILSTEADISIIPEPVIPLAALEGPWSYIAAGHIHRAQGIGDPNAGFLPAGTAGTYSGSIDRMNFGEEGEQKGVFVVNLDGSEKADVVADFHEVPATRFVTIDWPEGPAVGPPDVEDAIVRVRGQLRSEDDRELMSMARNAWDKWGARSVTFDLKVTRQTTSRAVAIAEDVEPLAGLDQWMTSRGIPDDDQVRLRKMAAELMEAGD